MEWLSSNWQLVLLLLYITGGFRWMVGRVDKVEEKLNLRIDSLGNKVSEMEKDVSMIKGMLSGTKFRTDP